MYITIDTRYMAAGLSSGRDCWPAFVAQSAADPSQETSYSEWQAEWPPALAEWPSRRPRAVGSTPDGPHSFAGPAGSIDKSHATALHTLLQDGTRHGPSEQPPPAAIAHRENGLVSRAKF